MRFLGFILLLAFPLLAGIIKDTKNLLVFTDSVTDYSVKPCKTNAEIYPENIFYRANSTMPYRVYTIALPTNQKPRISILDKQTKNVGATCYTDSLKFSEILIETPILRDGVYMTDIWVPLFKGSANARILRELFEITVSFSGNPSGKNPGKRALNKVLNKNAARTFGQNTTFLRKASNAYSNTEWLLRFAVGDKEHATFSETGLYGVSFQDIKKALSIVSRAEAIDGVKIKDLRLYGASADTLTDVPGNSSQVSPNHLKEIPLEVIDKNQNQIFDSGDSLYFVGYGTSLWKRVDLENVKYKNIPMPYYFSSSPYSYYQYFQLGLVSSGEQKKLSEFLKTTTGGNAITPLRYVRAEKDLLLRDTYFGRDGNTYESSTGKEWFWTWNLPTEQKTLSSNELNFNTTANLPGIIPSENNYIAWTFFPRRSTATADLGDGMTQAVDQTLSGKSYEMRMEKIQFSYSVNSFTSDSATLSVSGNFVSKIPELKANKNTYSLTIIPNGNTFDRFDGYSVAYPWEIKTDSADWILPGIVSGKIKIEVPKNANILKFSDGIPVASLNTSSGFITDSISLNEDARYLIYNKSKILTPVLEGIPKRNAGVLTNISSISSKTEYLIIAPEEFETEALTLANFRASDKSAFPLPTTLVLAEDIYKFYNGGSLSPIAIRDYLSYAKSVCPNLKYVLLAGDAHFDYRQKNTSFSKIRIPVFEKEDALIEDFFAVLDSGESVRFGVYDLDLAVGRLPLESKEDFKIYNQKIMQYEQKSKMDNSKWRNTITISADDSKNSSAIDYQKHTEQAEHLAQMLDSLTRLKNYSLYFNKIYLLDYEEDALAQKPEANADLINAMNQGSLFTVYFGHGSITDWASEGLLKPSSISKLSNENLYTILASFSCSLGRFDKGDETSLSEQFIKADSKGSVISIGSTRESYGNLNEVFAKNFFYHAYKDSLTRIGDAYIKGKGLARTTYSSQRYNNERYALLGEPVVSLPVQNKRIHLEQKIDSIKALDKMKISGSVEGIKEGSIYLSVREGKKEKQLSFAPASDDSIFVSYTGTLIYNEIIPLKNGKFETEFLTPKKIAFGDSAAEISAYAYSTSDPYIARFLKSGILIAGTSDYADSINDNTPPEIHISSCYSSRETYFSENETIRLESPACLIVQIEDSTALDFSEEADEGISFEVIDKVSPFHPWPYMEQNAKKVVVKMNFTENIYAPGIYNFKVRAQDILGNASEKIWKIEITEKLKNGLADVFNVPNPMKKKGTTFYFKNLAIGYDSDVTIYIFNQNGRMVNRIKHAKSGETFWDGRDFYGRKLANGLYHYIVESKVKSTESKKVRTFKKKQKLLISR